MATPKGKILLAKLPKDIVQFCIEPFLMIPKEKVRQNYQNLMNQFHSYNPNNLNGWDAIWNPQAETIEFVTTPLNFMAGDRPWRDMILGEVRRKRRKIRLAAKQRKVHWSVICVFFMAILLIALLMLM